MVAALPPLRVQCIVSLYGCVISIANEALRVPMNPKGLGPGIV